MTDEIQEQVSKGKPEEFPKTSLGQDTVLEEVLEEPQNSQSGSYNGSFEQQLFVDSGFKDGAYNFFRAFYGTAMTYLRAPTTIRKLINHQTFIQREKLPFWTGGDEPTSIILGGFVGFFAPIIYCLFTGYDPTKLLLTTNALVGAFELGRWSRSKQENLEMKAQKAESLEIQKPTAEPLTEKPETEN